MRSSMVKTDCVIEVKEGKERLFMRLTRNIYAGRVRGSNNQQGEFAATIIMISTVMAVIDKKSR